MKKVYLSNIKKFDNNVEDGIYDGLQSGYVVQFITPNGEYEGQSNQGIRGMNEPCKVKVKDGKFQVLPVDISE